MITRQQIRAVMADGARVVDSAGHSVGRIVDVVLDVQTLEPAYMTVACGRPPEVAVVVPLTGARLLDGSVQVPYTAAGVSGAPARGRVRRAPGLAAGAGAPPLLRRPGRPRSRRAVPPSTATALAESRLGDLQERLAPRESRRRPLKP